MLTTTLEKVSTMPARKPSSGKRSAKKTVKATEQKFGKAARVAAQRGGQKPMAWQQSEKPKRDVYVAPTEPRVGATDAFVAPPKSAQSFRDQKPDGFAVSATRTLDGSASDVFRAFNDPTRRNWCHERMYSVRSAVAPRMLRVQMPDETIVTVAIMRKGNTRSTVTVDQTKLADAAAADRAKQAWRVSLDRLAAMLDE